MKPEVQSSLFDIHRRLGRGGMGVVYEATNKETGARVALKTLRRISPDLLLRFKNEFRLLAEIQHPNLVRLGELHCEQDQWYFTMELVRGIALIDFVRPMAARPGTPAPRSVQLAEGSNQTDVDEGSGTPTECDSANTTRLTETVKNPPHDHNLLHTREDPFDSACHFDESRLRSCLRQLAVAIYTLHQLGRVHRDIKPSNVLVTLDGRVVLLDFGLTSELSLDGKARDDSSFVVGTPKYMAPEQFSSNQVGPEVDWYAFGALLFECLVGRVPFVGSTSIVRLLKEQQAAPAPRSILPDIPQDLDELCRALLHNNPRQRPDGIQILERLGALDDSDTSTLAHRIQRQERAEQIFVGREAELQQLNDVLKAIQGQGSAALLICGEPGIGKTCLARHFLVHSALRDVAPFVLRGRCYEQEAVPFSAFDALIDMLAQHLRGLAPETLMPLLGYGVQSLANLFPVLHTVKLIAARRMAMMPSPMSADMRTRAFEEFRELLTHLASVVPLLLFIDDLQWADSHSLELLRYLLSPSGIPRCGIVATLRTPAGSGRDGIAAALGETGELFQSIALEPLPPIVASTLLAELWRDRDSSAGTDRELFQTLVSESAGHPLFLSELARSARLVSRDASARISLDEVLQERIQRLDDAPRQIMLFVALVGVPAPYAAIVDAAGVDPTGAQELLSQLRGQRLLRARRRNKQLLVEPYHDRVREAIRAFAVRPDELPRMHLVVGRSLVARTDDTNPDADIFLIVKHLQLGVALMESNEERLHLAELELRAGRLCTLATAYDAAAMHIEFGSRLLAEDSWTTHYELTKGLRSDEAKLDYLCNRPEPGAERIQEVIERVKTNIEKAELYAMKADLENECGRFEEAMQSARTGLALFKVRLPFKGTISAIMRELLAVRWVLGRRTTSSLYDLPDLANADAAAMMDLLMASAAPSFFAGGNLYPWITLRITRLSLKHGISPTGAYAFAAFGSIMSGVFRKYSAGSAWGALATELIEKFDARHMEGRVWMLRAATTTGWTDPWEENERQFSLAIQCCRLYSDPFYEVNATNARQHVSVAQGRTVQEARERLESWLTVARVRANINVERTTDCMQHWCRILSQSSPPAESLATATAELLRRLDDEQSPIALFYFHLLSAKLHYLFGQTEEAHRLIRESDRYVENAFANPSNAEHRLAHALIAARVHDLATRRRERRRLRRTVKRCARWLERCAASCPANFEAHLLLAAGESARLAGKHAIAADCFQRAVESAERHHAPEREALARELLARHARITGDQDRADELDMAAIAAYERWGAPSKAAHLKQRPDLDDLG